MPSYDEALALLHEHVQSDSLRVHNLSVSISMRYYAKFYEEDEESWAIAGLLHDMDYERYPSLDDHPYRGVEIMKEKGYDEQILQAILGHGEHTGVQRETLMAKTLFAVDELSGFILALAKIRPGNFDGMTAKSVKKALKKKAFAAAVSRDDIQKGIDELEVDKDEHFERVITALTGQKEALGF